MQDTRNHEGRPWIWTQLRSWTVWDLGCAMTKQICAICQDEMPHVGRTPLTSLDERGRLPSLRMGGFLEHHLLVDDAPIQKIIYNYYDLPIEGWEGRNLFKPLDILEKPQVTQVAISRSVSSSCNSCQHQFSGRSSYGLNSSIIVESPRRLQT